MSDLVGNPEDRFSRGAAHITTETALAVNPFEVAFVLGKKDNSIG